jgi:trans-aconitate methyltransferase
MSQGQAWDKWWDEHGRFYAEPEQQASGAEYVEQLVEELREFVPNFAPRTILDFGCGKGRIMLPLAQTFPQAHSVGVDISDEAIGRARTRLSSCGLQASFIDLTAAEIQGSYDLLHSFIVFQHIPVKAGLKRFAELIAKLNPNGIGVIHFVYARPKSFSRRALYHARKWLPGAQALGNILSSIPPLPFVQMNPYPLDKLLRILQESGCHRVGARFSEHGRYLGVRLMFQKRSLPLL